MAKHTNTVRLNIMMCIAACLFCLTLISVHFTSGLYAKYIVTDSGKDSAAVIPFGELTLTEEGDFSADGSMMIIPGVSLQKKATVEFAGSESSAYVFAEVVISSQWQTADNRRFAMYSGSKELMSWSVDNTWQLLDTVGGDAYIYYCEVDPNTPFTADIIADDGTILVSDHITKNEISNMDGVFINLRASAVQSGGFDSPAAAWQSLATKEGSSN